MVAEKTQHSVRNVGYTARIIPRHSYAKPWLEAVKQGFRRHNVEIVDRVADLTVIWSFHDAHKAPGDYLLLECGYIDRFEYSSFGLNGLNGVADFNTENVPFDRAKQWEHLLKPEHGGDYTLIVGQCPGDASIYGLDVVKWAETVAKTIDGPVFYRPHPKQPTTPDIPTLSGGLEAALNGAGRVITYTSNVGVDARLNGCNVEAHHPGSMIYNKVDRRGWLRKLAYCQWNLNEIASGEAWEHLTNPRLFGAVIKR